MNIDSLVRNNIKNISSYSSARDDFKKENDKKLIYLDANESPFDNGINRYPHNKHDELKKVVSGIKNVNVNQVVFGNGTDEIGFAGAPGGVRNGEPFDFGGGNYAGEGELGFWWSSTATAPLGSALNRVLSATNPGVNRSAIQNQFGMSVRCVLDHE